VKTLKKVDKAMTLLDIGFQFTLKKFQFAMTNNSSDANSTNNKMADFGLAD